MSLHQITDTERQRAQTHRELRSRLERMAVKKIVVPAPVAPKTFNQSLLDWNCLQYYKACFEPVPQAPVVVPQVQPTSVSMQAILRAVSRRFQVSINEIKASRRLAVSVRPRQIVMWLAKELTLRSYPEIGAKLGSRDHTTIMHGVKRIETLRKSDPDLQEHLDHLLSALRPVSPEDEGNAEINRADCG